jgi:hypothetical protein
MTAVHFVTDMPASDRNVLEMIATESQLVRPDREQLTWTVLERDGAGEYLAIYTRADTTTVIKRKLKYVYLDGAAGLPANSIQVTVEQSESRFSIDQDGGIGALDGSNRVQMAISPEQAGQLTTVAEIHLVNPRKSSAPELIGSLERARPQIVSSPVVTQKADPVQVRAELDDKLLEGHSTESLLQAAAEKDSGDPMLPDRLKALFRRRPEAAVSAVALLRKSGSRKQITYALGTAATPSSVEALSALARDASLPVSFRIDVLTAFAVMQSPSVAGMRAPVHLLGDSNNQISSTAQLVCGALARAGRPQHPEEADRIDEELISQYRKAQTAAERSDLLAALGNSVGPSAVAVIKEALRDPGNPARATAARALRLAMGPDIDALLGATIRSDSDAAVRGAAIFAVSFRHPMGSAIGEALLQAAKADPVDYVRSAAISLLRQSPNSAPNIPETLAFIAEHDANAGIRRLARNPLVSEQVAR